MEILIIETSNTTRTTAKPHGLRNTDIQVGPLKSIITGGPARVQFDERHLNMALKRPAASSGGAGNAWKRKDLPCRTNSLELRNNRNTLCYGGLFWGFCQRNILATCSSKVLRFKPDVVPRAELLRLASASHSIGSCRRWALHAPEKYG
jgi:hypothetical protein